MVRRPHVITHRLCDDDDDDGAVARPEDAMIITIHRHSHPLPPSAPLPPHILHGTRGLKYVYSSHRLQKKVSSSTRIPAAAQEHIRSGRPAITARRLIEIGNNFAGKGTIFSNRNRKFAIWWPSTKK